MDRPQPLLELGGASLVSHNLWQLNTAGYKKVVVVVGFQGAEVQRQLSAAVENEKDVFGGLSLDFVDLGAGWRGGRAAAIAAAGQRMSEVAPGENIVVIGADHIFDSALLETAATLDLSTNGDEAAVLVETDIEGMVGLPEHTVLCAMRPLHGADRIYNIGLNLETYSGIDAGLKVLTPSTLQEVISRVTMGNTGNNYTVLVNDVLSDLAKIGTLRMLKTEGHTWFGVETERSGEYAKEGLKAMGQEYELSDGRKINLVGLPKKVTGKSGGEWSEFSVEKWRSAVYTAASFFEELFVDTTDFVGELCDELGGNTENGPLLVEVGCGTGEALLPLFGRARYTCGMDFNPHFINFCQQNVPKADADRVAHLIGDASELRELLQDGLPATWNDRPKVVICVGNTIGILPPEVKKKTYEEMKLLAGKDGYMVVVYWNGNKFGEAVQHFYNKNPQLCGPFKGDSIDLDTCTLTTPSGYRTHWTVPEEARAIFENDVGVDVVRLKEMGRGVLVAGRMK